MRLALMIDTETLSLRPTAHVVQVGWCVANRDTGKYLEPPQALWPMADQQAERTRDYDTITWWLRQDRAVADSVFRPPIGSAVTVGGLFDLFQQKVYDYAGRGAELTVWAKPAMMDLPLLTDLWGGRKPWHFHAERCLQTYIREYDPEATLAPPPCGPAHNASADADYQMRYLLAIDAARAAKAPKEVVCN